jgi:signal transduction histidine kinase
MRRRLFWTIAGVAALTGLFVLAAAVFASQRAAVDATYRELRVSADEAANIIQERVEQQGPLAAIAELNRLLSGDQLSRTLAQIRRTAGGSEIAFGYIDSNGTLRTNASLFERVDLGGQTLREGETTRTTSSTGELVVVIPTTVTVGQGDVTLLVGLAREAPIVRLSDQGAGLLLLIAGIAVAAAGAATLLAHQLAKRLEPLAEASRRVARGESGVRVPSMDDPDLDEVGGAFNEMATELEVTRDREREFILGVGHDLRTPLTTIGGYAEALEAGGLEESELKRIGAVLGTQSRQLGRLIDDLSMLARLEQAEFGLRHEPVDVGAHVTEVVEGFRRRADELGVGLSVEAQPGMVVETDPDRLGQIAQNLVENALRHTPETGTVNVEVESDDSSVVIVVADSGSGISPEDLPHVFDRYFVGRQRSVRKEGSGLGLSIVKGLVDRMGGSVEADSQLGKGTTITVRLDRQPTGPPS